jgi:hypothetical protein
MLGHQLKREQGRRGVEVKEFNSRPDRRWGVGAGAEGKARGSRSRTVDLASSIPV